MNAEELLAYMWATDMISTPFNYKDGPYEVQVNSCGCCSDSFELPEEVVRSMRSHGMEF